jgi:uncharacterized protein (TIGR03085 family)
MPKSRRAQSERGRLCDILTEFGPDAATLCSGWLTRDLAAHLFARERRPLAMPGILLGGPFPRLTAGSMSFALRSYGYRGLVTEIRSGPPFLWRPIDGLVNFVEFFVHTEDVSRAAPIWEPRNDPQLDEALWGILARMARVITRKIRGAGLELERPDGERMIAHGGEPRAVLSGGAQELVLFLYGRQQVARVSLSGDEKALRIVRAAGFEV